MSRGGAEDKKEKGAHRGPPTGLNRSWLEPKWLLSLSLSLCLTDYLVTTCTQLETFPPHIREIATGSSRVVSLVVSFLTVMATNH